MAWIKTVDDQNWTGKLASLRSAVVDPETDQVDHIMAVHSLDAASMNAHLVLYRQAMKSTKTLPKVDREMIALAVSKTNGCHY